MQDGAVEIDERRAKMERLRAEGIDPYPPVSLWASARGSPTCSPRTTRPRSSAGEHPELRLPRSPAG